MYLVAECFCKRELHLPVEPGRVISTTCGHCGTIHDINLYKNSYRTDNVCVHHELVKAGVSEAIDKCNPAFCGGKCKCPTKK
jgi:hypothetical protein